MGPTTVSSSSADWRNLTSLGEQLASTTSLTAQRDRIIKMVGRLIEGEVDIWLKESLFRLPDWGDTSLFPPEPPANGMHEAYKKKKIYVGAVKEEQGLCISVPLVEQGIVMGVIRVQRSDRFEFSQEELELLEVVSSIIAISLTASHRTAVEYFHTQQLQLVRKVGAQIANVLDVDELSWQVTKLIQETFHYYYVAVFTKSQDGTVLHFRSSASINRQDKPKIEFSKDIQIGNGLIGTVAETGEEIVCADVNNEPRFAYIESLPGTQSEVVLPLKIEDRMLGVLDVQSDQLNAFHPNDLLILRALADNIAIAVEGARLYGDLRLRADQLEVIADVNKLLTATLELRQQMQLVADLIQSCFGHRFVHLFTVHHNRRRIILEAGSGEYTQSLQEFSMDLNQPEGIIPWVARNAKTVLANDVSKEPRYRISSQTPEITRSELTVPLVFDDVVVGVLDLQSERLGAFSDDDRLAFEALADSIAAAIHNADLYSSEQWRRQVADSLREVAVLLSENAGVEDVLEVILTELERNLPSEVAVVWLLEEGELYPAAVHGCDPAFLIQARRDSLDASLVLASALLGSQPLIRKPEDAMDPAGVAVGFKPDYSSIAAPLRIGEDALGVLTLAHSTSGRYGHEAQAMTTTFAGYAAVAIENARLYDAAQEQAYASAALLQVAQAVVTLNELDEILGSIVRIMPILVGISRVAIYLWDPETELFKLSDGFGFPKDANDAHSYSGDDFPILKAAKQSNSLVVSELQPDQEPTSWPDIIPIPQDVGDHLFQSEASLLFSVPLSIKGDLYGVMLVQEACGGRRFRNRRLEIVTGIAQQAALAIQNDRLQAEKVIRERLEYEVLMARQIQETFIPDHLPVIRGWELAARWRPARQVGGDFYDVIELPEQKLGLFIADVADKGMPAALFMALTRTLVRAAVLQNDSPAKALQQVNDLLMPDTEQGMFVTAVYAVLDLKSGEVVYANAGHNPPLWVKCGTGEFKRLTRTGMALGAMAGVSLDDCRIQLAPDECLLLYTDGLTEAFAPSGDMFGEDGLFKTINSLTAFEVEDMLRYIEDQIDDFMGALPPSDDLTMLAVRRRP
ncbi:MAG: GAF domain-containing protein [Anaerolineales bacterium]|nr:GAF domain-containing protein [Anaerolineales bacterium]